MLFIIDYPLFRIMSPPTAEARENISDKIFPGVGKTHSIDKVFQNQLDVFLNKLSLRLQFFDLVLCNGNLFFVTLR